MMRKKRTRRQRKRRPRRPFSPPLFSSRPTLHRLRVLSGRATGRWRGRRVLPPAPLYALWFSFQKRMVCCVYPGKWKLPKLTGEPRPGFVRYAPHTERHLRYGYEHEDERHAGEGELEERHLPANPHLHHAIERGLACKKSGNGNELLCLISDCYFSCGLPIGAGF